jgi:biuret amidohydrolase
MHATTMRVHQSFRAVHQIAFSGAGARAGRCTGGRVHARVDHGFIPRTPIAMGRSTMAPMTIEAQPGPLSFAPAQAALIIIDMQRDFIEPGGFGASLGNDVSLLRSAIQPCQKALAAARAASLFVIHTREGHRPDLADAPPAKRARGADGTRIGDPGPMGRILIRGEAGHGIIAELAPAVGEPVIDKPGKGAFYQTDLELMLRNRGIDTLFVAGVTTEVCVHTTIREANDRGYRCVALADCCGSYFPEFHRIALDMIKAQGSKGQGGIFGWVAGSAALIDALAAATAHDETRLVREG